MLKKFIIDDEILYDPQQHTMTHRREPDRRVNLNVPTSRCLQALLSQKGLVTHQELYEKGWFDAAQEPLPNTLYQNILLIRQAFRKLSNKEQDFIVTVPRKGFYFNDSINFFSIEDDASLPPQHFPDEMQKQTQANSAETEPSSARKKFKLRTILPSWLSVMLLIAAFILAGMATKLLFISLDADQFAEDFIHSQTIQGCEIFISKKTKEDRPNTPDAKTSKALIEITHANDPLLTCENYPIRFLSIYKSPPRTIMFACTSREVNSYQQKCMTVYIRGNNE